MTFRNKNFFNRLVISYKMSKQRGLTELINPAIFGYRFHLNWEIKC